MSRCVSGVCSSPVHCDEIGRCFSSMTVKNPGGPKAFPEDRAPIDMVLYCPRCGVQHIDAPETYESYSRNPDPTYVGWTNPPHRSHLCHGCDHIWRPADVPTNGVEAVKTKGKNDSPVFEGVDCESEAQGYALEAIWQFLPELPCRDDGLTVLTPAQVETVLRRCGWLPPSEWRGDGKWVPVDERLPDGGGTYIVGGWTENPRVFGWAFCLFRRLVDGPAWEPSDLLFPIQFWHELPPAPPESHLAGAASSLDIDCGCHLCVDGCVGSCGRKGQK
jgi:hypothetical protein